MLSISVSTSLNRDMTVRTNWAKSSSAVDLGKKKKASVDENFAGKFEIFQYKLDLPRCMILSPPSRSVSFPRRNWREYSDASTASCRRSCSNFGTSMKRKNDQPKVCWKHAPTSMDQGKVKVDKFNSRFGIQGIYRSLFVWKHRLSLLA